MNYDANRKPCPAFAEPIMQAAKICLYCKAFIVSKDAGKNAALNLMWYVATFFLLFYAISAFVDKETERIMAAIKAKAAADTDALMRKLYAGENG